MSYNKELDIRQRLKDDFTHYARKCLKIRTKSGTVESLILNKSQQYIHAQLQNQLERTGKVRAIILKGRQQGCSTYVEARYYHKVTHTRGYQAFILTHEQKATDNLFALVSRYHEHCPAPLKPRTTTSSAKELNFGNLDSGYGVGTAGSKGVGRSSTLQLFHGSEVAFWPHADTHATGVMQAISDSDGTEVILESTANGIGNYFHKQWQAAEAGLSDYIAIFVPWFWQLEYQRTVDSDFELTDDEQELKRQFGISDDQLAWRRYKIVELSTGGVNGLVKFKQEYPMNAAEAFQMSGVDTLITADKVMECRKNKVKGIGPRIVGVDPSHGGDRFALITRQGRKLYDPQTYVRDSVDTLQKRVGIVLNYIDDHDPDAVFVDSGFGADIVDYMRGNLNIRNVRAVAFGSSPQDKRKYKNKRAEMWGRMSSWINDEDELTQVPDDDALQADICACPYTTDLDNRLQILSKDKIKELVGFSPDIGDAAALTFAETVRPREVAKPARAQASIGFSVF